MKGYSGGKVPRTERLNSEFKKEIYEIISRRLNDPEITEMFSVTKVDVSRDLSYAKVFVSVFSVNAEKGAKTFEAIKKNAGRIRRELSCSMRIRTVPELNFISDDSMAYSDKMNKLFAEIEKGENK
ncbi:MAG: 30S ribosome-binding factor RbfA [Clostridia bacterium]|nr:30S ribosome-binding factor RbfA [Clostridia bacterium]